jgi:NAD(P)-dependent dehydrogenase (short-subunit alcohol dehydrogenase family)
MTNVAQWVEAHVPDQSGRIALITGANSGIGLETARILARQGAHVVMACRTRSKAEAGRANILQSVPKALISLVDLDLGSLHSISEAAEAVGHQFNRLDLLINNAGVMATPRGKTADGFETQFGTNHLGHFALTGLLMPLWSSTEQSRVVTVSSLAHTSGAIHFDDLQSEQRYKSWAAYCQSKLANLMFSYELQRRLGAAGLATIAVAAHPGLSNTGLLRSTGGVMGRVGSVLKPALGLMMQGSEMGCLPTVLAAVDPKAVGGEYYGPSGFMEQRGTPKLVDSNAASKDAAVAARLWTVSETLTGVNYLD